MSNKSTRVPKRRRRENKTDYRARLVALKSNLTRIVIRKTNKYIVLQAVETIEAQDKVIAGISSKKLLDNGWNAKFAGSLKSVPAAYLTGMLMAKKLGKSSKRYILDIGMARNIKGSRIYAAGKGLIDGGLNVNIGESALPSKERLEGAHLDEEIKNIIKEVKEKLIK